MDNTLRVTDMIEVFDIAFDGVQNARPTTTNKAVSEGIIGTDSMLSAATSAIYGHLVEPEIDIRRQPDGTTYSIDLGFRRNFGMARRAQLSGVPALMDPSAEVVVAALGWKPCKSGRIGLFQLLAALKGRPLEEVSLKEECVLIEAGGESYEVDIATYQLMRHAATREAIDQMVSAFEDPAVSKIEIRARGADKPVIEIERKDAASFAMPAVQEVVLVDEIHRQALQLPNSTFRDDQIWTFFDGEQTIRARMEDADFLRVIDHGVFRLNAGDIPVVNMHVCTKQTPSGLVSDYEVVRVLDVRKPGKHVLVPGV